MSLKKLSLQKLKKKCQQTLYQSIDKNLDLIDSQTYLPAFTGTLNFENKYSKKMFIFNSKFVLLEVKKDDSIITEKKQEKNNKEENHEEEEKKPNKLTFPISETLQGNVIGKIVNNKLYQKSKIMEDYVRFVAEIPMFLKSNPLIDVISYMEGKYEFNTSIPSIFSLKTNKKINDINNNAYLEVICAYYLNLLQENKLCSLFPNYYGSFNGIAKNYVHDISEDYPHIRNSNWFVESSKDLKYEIIRNNNLEGYQELSFKNIEKIDYEREKDNQYKKNRELEINNIEEETNLTEENLSKLDMNNLIDLDNPIDLPEINFNYGGNKNSENYELEEFENQSVKEIEKNIIKLEELEELEEFKNQDGDLIPTDIDLNQELERLEEDLSSQDDELSISSQYSESSFDSISSQGSCIFAETFLKIRDFPVQILAMERLEITLTELVKTKLSLLEWKSYLFEICFGLSVAQKHFSFIHNDLHSDNIMFKSTKIKEKYYQYQDKFFKVPTYGRETKVIDFARGILKVGKRTYFSDVFKNEGDAGGQYNYLNKQKNKKFNFHFDLARLATTIYEFTDKNKELEPINNLLTLWTESNTGDSFLEMEDNFSLYVKIAESACNSLPKDQIISPIFKEYQVDFEHIPPETHIYKY